MARLEQEIEILLANRLRDPSDRATEQALISLRAQRNLAEARLEERLVRAPDAGRVSDLRVRPGQFLSPGQLILSLVEESVEPRVIVLLPGSYRPQVKPGMEIRLEITGFQYAYQRLTVASVSDEVIGPTEAQRFLGPGIADAVAVSGPVALIEARLPSATFVAEGTTFRYHDGMHARADVRVRSEKILVALVPGLKLVREKLEAFFGEDSSPEAAGETR
jgi:membrane fusion protein (multidrug efflux system)